MQSWSVFSPPTPPPTRATGSERQRILSQRRLHSFRVPTSDQEPFKIADHGVVNNDESDASTAAGPALDDEDWRFWSVDAEVEEGRVEYKVRISAHMPSERFQSLVTQMNWRLAEGQGEAVYLLGVADAGILIGLTQAELDDSLKMLKHMASLLGSSAEVAHTVEIDGDARQLSARLRSWRVIKAAQFRQGVPVDHQQDAGNNPADIMDNINDVLALGEDHEDGAAILKGSLDGVQDLTVADIERYGRLLGNLKRFDQRLQVAEVLVRRRNSDVPASEVRLAFLGATDSGKSTLLAYFSHGELDNGRGRARLHLLRHRHEIETGRSSSITRSMLIIDPFAPLPFLTSESTAQSPHNRSHQRHAFSLMDTCGHPKYLHTTLNALTGLDPHGACVVIDASAGLIESVTCELLGYLVVLAVPFFIVLNKTDKIISEPSLLSSTLQALVQLLQASGHRPAILQQTEEIPSFLQGMQHEKLVPICCVSCVSGDNLPLVREFIMSFRVDDEAPPFNQRVLSPSTTRLHPAVASTLSSASIQPWRPSLSSSNLIEPPVFIIEETFSVPEVGTVVGGRLCGGKMEENDAKPWWLGPISDQFVRVAIGSLQRFRQNASTLSAGQTGSVAISAARESIHRSEQAPQNLATREFEADVLLLCSQRRSSFSGSLGASPEGQLSSSCPVETVQVYGTVHVGAVRQAANVFLVPGRMGQRARVRIKFFKASEYIRPGMRVMFRESGGHAGVKFVGRVAF